MRFIKPCDKRYPIDQDHAAYASGGYLDSGYRRCSRHTIQYPEVADAVFASIRVQVEYALSQEKMVKRMGEL